MAEPTKKKKGPKSGMGLNMAAQEELPQQLQSFTLNDEMFQKAEMEIKKSGLTVEGQQVKDDIQMADLEIGPVIGEGVSSEVHRARHKQTGEQYVVKKVKLDDHDKRSAIMHELRSVVGTECDCLVKFHNAFLEQGQIHLVLEYMDRGSLADVVSHGKVPEDALSSISRQLLVGLLYLLEHKREVHRDLKPANVLCRSNGSVKLADFGVSKRLEDTLAQAATFVGTALYMSPERILGDPYSFSSDVWSFGLTILEMSLGKFPYRATNSPFEWVTLVASEPSPLPTTADGFSDEFVDFISQCLRKEAAARPAVSELLAHPFIVKHEKDGTAALEKVLRPLPDPLLVKADRA